jgi:hypothetical protein
MGRRNSPTVLDLYKKDIDALSDFMADKNYFFDDKVGSIEYKPYWETNIISMIAL